MSGHNLRQSDRPLFCPIVIVLQGGPGVPVQASLSTEGNGIAWPLQACQRERAFHTPTPALCGVIRYFSVRKRLSEEQDTLSFQSWEFTETSCSIQSSGIAWRVQFLPETDTGL